MGKKKNTMPGFQQLLQGKKIPLLILDQKWHQLFLDDKPKEIERLEQKLNKHLATQGRLNQELKELKVLKTKLMKNIVVNMDEIGEHGQESRKLSEDRRLITEINDKMEDEEVQMEKLQGEMEEDNFLLMVQTMEYCYRIMNSNEAEREQLVVKIAQMRTELKTKIYRRESIEEQNRGIYAYLHDIFGPRVLETFDLKYEDEYK
ncbi:MAG: hypothetical protein HFH36_04050 [Lachnospiraceae bacterium]|nr:hypothetical protein [Lachnospiraceae bacterium]